jgi:hypothetical protein
MVYSSVLAMATDGECLTCGGFSLSKTIHFGSLEFITDCFGDLSLSNKGSDSGAIFMRTIHSGSPSLWALIDDSIYEFYMASSGEGSSDLLAMAAHTMMMVPPWTLASRSYTGLPPER